MELFLAASGEHPDTIAKLEQKLTRPLADQKIAFIPTAGNSKDGPGAWRARDAYQTLKGLNPDLSVVELETLPRKQIEREIVGSDIIWVSGGQPGYLLYWLRRHYLDQLLTELYHQDNEKLYVGSSAGSMIFSESQTLATWEISDEIPERDVFPGLGLIDFEIFPHFDQSQLAQITMMWAKGDLWLIEDGEVIVVNQDGAEVLGEKKVVSK